KEFSTAEPRSRRLGRRRCVALEEFPGSERSPANCCSPRFVHRPFVRICMTGTSAIIDTSLDPVGERRRRWRAFLRLAIPIAAIALTIAIILAIALYLRSTSRQDILSLSNDLLDSIDSRIAREVSAYLDPAVRAIQIGRDLVTDGATGDRQALAIAYASAV